MSGNLPLDISRDMPADLVAALLVLEKGTRDSDHNLRRLVGWIADDIREASTAAEQFEAAMTLQDILDRLVGTAVLGVAVGEERANRWRELLDHASDFREWNRELTGGAE